MKKRLFLLPVLAGLALTGCDFDFFGLFDKSAKAIEELGKNALKEFKGYKIATKVEDGKEYLMGVYRINENIIRFASGDYHTDSKGDYPFYLGTVGGTTEGAATVKVKMHGGGKFSLQMSCPGHVWDGKYVGLYPSKAVKNFVVSMALLDDPTQKTYDTIPNHQEGNETSKTVKCYGLYTWFDYYEGMPVCAPGITLQHPDTDEEPVPKFMGTGHNANVEKGEADYISIDAATWQKATDTAAYNLMHLYEKK